MKPPDSRLHLLIYLDTILMALLGLAGLTLYIRTLAPGLLFGDSAEFKTIAYTLGIGHPTGYPVYVLLAKSFTFLPVGDVAYRVNLVSAFCAALAIAFVYLSIRKLGARIPPAVYGSLTLALTPLFWKHATIAEIYIPSAACLAASGCGWTSSLSNSSPACSAECSSGANLTAEVGTEGDPTRSKHADNERWYRMRRYW